MRIKSYQVSIERDANSVNLVSVGTEFNDRIPFIGYDHGQPVIVDESGETVVVDNGFQFQTSPVEGYKLCDGKWLYESWPE